MARGRTTLGLAAALLLPLAGCEGEYEVPNYRGLVGTISSIDPETSEVFVRQQIATAGGDTIQRTVVCLVNRGSELYVNDLVRPLAALQPGDEIEVLAAPDSRVRGRVIVATANVKRPAPAPTPPEWFFESAGRSDAPAALSRQIAQE
jgi:hypothetical protein